MASMTILLYSLVIFLGISHLMYFNNAIPITRIERLVHGHQVLQVQENTYVVVKEKSWEKRMNLYGKVAVELNDYPGAGANHRHTPWPPQLGRSCADC